MWRWLLGNDNSSLKTYLVIDIGTASVSAALAMGDGKGFFEVVATMRHPFELLASPASLEHEKRAGYVVSTAIQNIFKEAYSHTKNVDIIRVAFADIFFQELERGRVFTRDKGDEAITRSEVDAALRSLEAEPTPVRSLVKDLASVSASIIHANVNGYAVADPVGYRGKTLELAVRHLLVSKALKEHIEDAKARFFASSSITYYADERLLEEALMRQKYTLPVAVLDIGGEMTSIFLQKTHDLVERRDPVFFGVRTLERRIAAFSKADIGRAESLLRRFTANTLDGAELKKIQPTIDRALTDWWELVFGQLKLMRPLPAQLVITGAGRDLVFFKNIIEEKYKNLAVLSEPFSVLLLTIPQDVFVPQKSFAAGGDTILGLLLIYAK